MKKIALYTSFLLMAFLCIGCAGSDVEETPTHKPNDKEDDEPEVVQTWQEVADASTNALLEYFWNNSKNYFNYYPYKADTDKEAWHYWPQAHAMDVIIDAYARTGDASWKRYFSLWHEGVKQKSGGSYYNDFVDDMEWICLTMIRLYEYTNEQKYMDTAELLWNKIKENWNEQGGGGIAWKQSQQWSKNSCSNGPAGIIAARMYRFNGEKTEDLNWAKKIYNWQTSKLVDVSTGAVYDNLNAQTGQIKKDWIFTYNQGTYMGMAHELYKLTGNGDYLAMALKAADYTMARLTTGGILKSEGMEDGGLFKGIFIRYFTKLIMDESISGTERNRLVQFFDRNATAVRNKGHNGEDYLYSDNWTTAGSLNNDLPCQVSASTMIEAKAFFDKQNEN